MRKTIAALTATTVCALGGAAVAQAKPLHYSGTTKEGNAISFTLRGNKISKVRTEVPTLCASPGGGPRAGTSAFDPSGAFAIGHRVSKHAKRENEMGVTSDVTKHFVVRSHRGKHRKVTVKLHVDYSFLEVQYTYPISSKTFVCTGDDSFSLRTRRS
jgi:hypothetical protein